MLSLTLDAGLNLLWLGISVAALLWFGRLEWRRSARVRWQRLFPVFLATVALFPIVSDSDDLFSFSLMRVPAPNHRSAGATPTPEDTREQDSAQLARLLESLEHWQVSAVYQVVLALCFFALLRTLRLSVFSRPVFASPGRAPPLS